MFMYADVHMYAACNLIALIACILYSTLHTVCNAHTCILCVQYMGANASLPNLSLFLPVSVPSTLSMTPGAQPRLTSKGNVSLTTTLHYSNQHAVVLILLCCGSMSACTV